MCQACPMGCHNLFRKNAYTLFQICVGLLDSEYNDEYYNLFHYDVCNWFLISIFIYFWSISMLIF